MTPRKAPWLCPNDDCMTTNWHTSQRCLMCGEPKPDDVPAQSAPKEVDPLTRIGELADSIRSATPFNTCAVPPSEIHAMAFAIGDLVKQLKVVK